MGVCGGFTVGDEQLTPQGMRQRYLLGAYNAKRYTEEFQLLDMQNENEEEILFVSTIVNRTIQSGYSELMGMARPYQRAQDKLTERQEQALAPGGVASPPFRVRDQRKLNEELGVFALPEGLFQMPLFNRIEADLADDLDLTGCDYVNAVDGYRFPAESTYQSVEFLKDDLREPFTIAFNLTEEESENMSFMDLYGKSDIVQSNEFEGLGTGYDYTPD